MAYSFSDARHNVAKVADNIYGLHLKPEALDDGEFWIPCSYYRSGHDYDHQLEVQRQKPSSGQPFQDILVFTQSDTPFPIPS